jgi:N-acetylglutamate synthase-like GNAT family acetyltransferase
VEGPAAARALAERDTATAVETSRVSSRSYCIRTAVRSDDEEIRSLLRDTVFPGAIRISLEREPDSLEAGAIEGAVHQTIVLRDGRTGQLAAIASRAVRPRFVNGAPLPVGYLGQLRVAPRYRRRRGLLDAGFDFCRQLHQKGNARAYLASVVVDNHAALALLNRRRPGWPRFEQVARLTTFTIPVRRAPTLASSATVVRMSESAVEDVVECLQRNNARYQFAPVWTARDLTVATPGLSPAAFRVAERSGRVVGCAALWDQRAVRQVVVRGYDPWLDMLRPVVNATARWTGAPRLPQVNTRLALGYISHLAVDDDDSHVACALIAAVCQLARSRGLEYVDIGLPSNDALTHAVRAAFSHRAYDSVLHLAYWPDGERLAATLDQRTYRPELATL